MNLLVELQKIIFVFFFKHFDRCSLNFRGNFLIYFDSLVFDPSLQTCGAVLMKVFCYPSRYFFLFFVICCQIVRSNWTI